METTNPSDPTRAGAVWVTATGSFLLFAAAVAFVAVRWDQIPDGMKLGALGAMSGGLLLVGRHDNGVVARRAPAAANVLYHLGAFLVPVTAAAVLVHLQVPQDQLLVALGLGSAALLGLLAQVERSVVLAWSSAAAVAVAAVGLGGLTSVPATGWLVLAALGALALRVTPLATAWAVTAALAPVVAMGAEGTETRTQVLELVEAIAGTGVTPGVVGLAAAALLLVITNRTRSTGLLAVAVTALVGGGVSAWNQLAPSPTNAVIAAASGFVLIEVTALLLRRDPFWAAPLDGAGILAEALALPSLLVVGVAVPLSATGWIDTDMTSAAALVLAAMAWLISDLRRAEGDDDPAFGFLVGGSWWLGTVSAVLSLLGAVTFATGSGAAVGLTALALGGVLVLSGRQGSVGLVPVLTVLAPVVAMQDLRLAAALGVAGSLLVAAQATLHRPDTAEGLAVWSLVPAIVAAALLVRTVDPLLLVLGTMGLCLVLAQILDRARAGDHLGLVGRVGGTVAFLAVIGRPAEEVAVAATVYLCLVMVETIRRDDPDLLWGLVPGVPLAVGALATGFGLGAAAVGLPLTLAAAPFAAAAVRWSAGRAALATTAGVLAAAGLTVASTDPAVLGTVLILDGVALLAVGLHLARPAAVIGGGGLAVVGVWQHLQVAGLDALDLYALPVAVLLWVVGTQMADRSVSSWVTHGPAVALAGGAALAERMGGGNGAHAVLAGVIGLLAVVEGGGRRLGAPLFLGTGLLVALTVHETTAVTAGVPTWAWLAGGGTLLVGAGLAMERHELGPVETGRRLVDVVQERYR